MKNFYIFMCFGLLVAIQSCKTPKLLVSQVSKEADVKVEEKQEPYVEKTDPKQVKWVDSIMQQMTIDEKIGQLFMVQAYSNRSEKEQQEIFSLIKNQHIGGLIFMQGSPAKQIDWCNAFQKESKYPLLIGFDGEWGLPMRIKPSFAYPYNMTLGAVQNDSLIYRVGAQIGKHCKEVGININFAPVVDINTNPLNPIIGNRSFGENKENVTKKSIAYFKGMQSVGVLANAKHFPGHGDTATDSHKTLPVINFDISRLEDVELYPYKKIVNSELASIMVGHLDVPALHTEQGRPTSLSKKVVTELLQEKLGFRGLVFTDGLNMKGVANYLPADSVAYEAFKAGNDMLLIPEDVANGVKMIKKGIENGEIALERLDHSVRKILNAKYKSGLQKYQPLNNVGIDERIHTIEDDLLFKQVAEASVTLVHNEGNLLPIKNLKQKIGLVSLGDDNSTKFEEILNKYTQIDKLTIANVKLLDSIVKPYDLIIISHHKSDATPWKKFDFTAEELQLIDSIAVKKKVILNVFTSPYTLNKVNHLANVHAVVVAYQNNDIYQSVAAQQIFGALPYQGKLPVAIAGFCNEGVGIVTNKLQRLSYGFPEEVQLNSKQLEKIDSIATIVVNDKIAPGLQVLVARKNKVVFEKSYGYFTYDKKQKVKNTDIYDVASLTKILGAFPLILKAYEDGVFTLDSKMGDLVPAFKGTSLEHLQVKEMLAHQSGLKAWFPFYKETLDTNNKPKKEYYTDSISDGFGLKVADRLYLKESYLDSIYKKIAMSPLGPKKYVYSDFTFIIFKKIIEDYYHKPFDKLLESFYLDGMGTNHLTYNPLQKFNINTIVPSEVDNYFRYQTVQGTVHDMAAAMMGGVSGHAGLFSNANDVAKMMQLYINKGMYGGEAYFGSYTFDLFNQKYYEGNRRALVLDKPNFQSGGTSTCQCTSSESFGHSGFTGTFTWADPKTELIYVFLSNRTYPSAENNLINQKGIRTKIQRIIQEAIIK